ncbi:dihydroorotase [Prosthecobacter vanneervenii]|uniref:Dihydroorotase n=1 Tax=Prosthecobacter vanneervenii TaxID=48466 RepID=A0A7W8DM75_9BACT|nr:dihydroorotase [Prosthecobacter vanneervenii]MBB5034922.1 dihydroorotase [Prosthecobacter vanneervenii]
MKRLYRNAQIASEDSPKLQTADVLVEGDRIIGVAAGISGVENAEIIDCTGRILLPGLFDIHVHAREPGQDDKENIASCAEAAINGGVTGFVMMPNTSPAIDNAGVVRSVLESARRTRIGPGIYTSGAITKGRKGEELAGIAGMKAAGCVMLTDDGYAVDNPQVLRRAMEYARDYDLPLASHCELKALSGKGCMHEGKISYALGLPGIPSISEEICISRDIRLAEYTGVHLNIQHVTTAEGMSTIKRAKDRGIRVTCEIAPHHLMFNHEHIGDYDTHYKMNPPLRTPEDNAALLQGLKDGWFDVIATDHAPHTPFEKNQDFASAPFGITGLETALVSLYDRYISKDILDWGLIVKRYSAEPRRLMKLAPVPVKEGGTAEFIVFNPARTTTFSRAFMKSKSSNTPFLDQTLQGMVERVVYRGEELLTR